MAVVKEAVDDTAGAAQIVARQGLQVRALGQRGGGARQVGREEHKGAVQDRAMEEGGGGGRGRRRRGAEEEGGFGGGGLWRRGHAWPRTV